MELNVTSETVPGLICCRKSEINRCCFQLNLRLQTSIEQIIQNYNEHWRESSWWRIVGCLISVCQCDKEMQIIKFSSNQIRAVINHCPHDVFLIWVNGTLQHSTHYLVSSIPQLRENNKMQTDILGYNLPFLTTARKLSTMWTQC